MNLVSSRLLSLSNQFRARHSQITLGKPGIFRAFSSGQQPDADYNRFNPGIAVNPHPAKRDKGGEDAATVSESFIALADGVGGWIESGVDPAKYSRQLCSNIYNLILYDGGARYMCNPRQLCVEAAKATTEMGSSTCVIASLDKEAPVLYTSNLGDSGYLLLRRTDEGLVSVYRSKEQTHGFNFPYQIGTGGDDPEKADTMLHNVDHNDILVVGTDGLFDNLFDEQIKELIWPFVSKSEEIEDPTRVADVIAEEAERLGADQQYLSPFAKSAREQFYDYSGGKQDDVTVAVAQIKLASKMNTQ